MNKWIYSVGHRCLFFHRYVVIEDTGFTTYHKCLDCKTRKIIQSGIGYQPVDLNWLIGKSATVENFYESYEGTND